MQCRIKKNKIKCNAMRVAKVRENVMWSGKSTRKCRDYIYCFWLQLITNISRALRANSAKVGI